MLVGCVLRHGECVGDVDMGWVVGGGQGRRVWGGGVLQEVTERKESVRDLIRGV